MRHLSTRNFPNINRLILSLFCLAFFFSGRTQTNQDSLWSIWKNTSNIDTVRLWALDKICEANCFFNPDTTITLTQLEYDFAKQHNLKKFMARAYLKKACSYKVKGDLVKSLYYNRVTLILTKELHHKKGIANCVANIGVYYQAIGNEINALRCFFMALNIYRQIPNGQEGTAVTLANLSHIYQLNGRVDSALSMLHQSLDIHAKRNDQMRIADVMTELGKMYYQKLQMDKAAGYLSQAVAFHEKIDAKIPLSYAYNELAKVYLNQKKYKEAKEVLLKSLAISEARKDSLAIGMSYMVLSNVIHYEGDKAKAIKYGERSMQALKSRNVETLILNQAIYMAMWYSEIGQYPKAVDMYDYYIKNRDVGNDTVRQELFRQQVKYDFEKKEIQTKNENEKKISALRSEAERRDIQKNLWLTIFISLAIILGLSFYFGYKYYKQKNIINDQKNNALKQKLLVSQMNPHFIFNSLNAVQNFIYRQDSYQAGIYLKQFSELIRMILDFSTKDFITLDEELRFLQNYLELQKLRFDKKLNYEIKIDEQLDRETVLVTPMLAQPFIENAIEHGIFYKDGEGFLSVSISFKDNTLIYEIEDNGIGLEAAKNMKKEVKLQHKSMAIEITKERLASMGLRNKEFTIEIIDKYLREKKSTGVYVKFATPYLTL